MTSSLARSAGHRRERTMASPRFRDGRFRNTTGITAALNGGKSMLSVSYEMLTNARGRAPKGTLPVLDPRAAWLQRAETALRTTWLGHSTVLLEMDGRRVLTDPVFGERASPTSFAGPKRYHATPVALPALPDVDVVLLTHDHYDHLCAETWRFLATRSMPIVTSLGVGARLEALGVDPARITELDWWESREVGGVLFTAVPAQHFSGRGLTDRNTTLWSSFVMQSSTKKVFFSGDTGLHDELADIAAKLGPFDLVMLEIGAFHPAWSAIHLGPENALIAHRRLGGGTLLPIHWGTFDLALHPWDEPAETLLASGAAAGDRLITPRLGAVVEVARVDGVDPWWREVRAARARLGA